MPLRWTVATPYLEGAVVQLAQHLAASGQLDEFVVPSGAVKTVARSLARRATGRPTHVAAKGELPTIEIAPWLEAIRIAARLGLGPGGRTDPMKGVRSAFDALAAARVSSPDVLVGLPGASLRSFSAHPEATRVLHQVDAHPRARNAVLRDIFGSAARREVLGPRLVDRIERELETAQAVIVPSRLVEQQMTSADVDPRKLVHAPYGVDLERFHDRMAPERRPGLVRLLFVGQVSYRKGIPFLLDAVRGLQVELTLVGPAVARELVENLPSNVTFRPAVRHEHLRDLFATADAFVIPSVEDAFALVVSEALASGLPVIATSATGAAETMLPEDGLVVPAADASSLRRAIQELGPLELHERRERAAAIRRRVATAQMNDWSHFVADVTTGVEERTGAERHVS